MNERNSGFFTYIFLFYTLSFYIYIFCSTHSTEKEGENSTDKTKDAFTILHKKHWWLKKKLNKYNWKNRTRIRNEMKCIIKLFH